MSVIEYSVVGFDYKDGVHTETVICHVGTRDAVDAFHRLMSSYGPKKFEDAKVLRKSDMYEQDRWYHEHEGWKRNVPDARSAE